MGTSQQFLEITASEPVEGTRASVRGCHGPLWASTGTKNPAYSDVLYVETLIGPHALTRCRPGTIDAFMDHGTVARGSTPSLEQGAAGAALTAPDDVTRQLEIEPRQGVLRVRLAAPRRAIEEQGGVCGGARRCLSPTPNPLRTGLRVGEAAPSRRCSPSSGRPAGPLSAQAAARDLQLGAARMLLPAQFGWSPSRTQMDDDSCARRCESASADAVGWPTLMIHYQGARPFDDDKHFTTWRFSEQGHAAAVAFSN